MTPGGNKIANWLRHGRRFEYTIVAVCFVWFLWIGLGLTRGEPQGTPLLWFFWVYAAIPPLIVSSLAFVFGPALRGLGKRPGSARAAQIDRDPPKVDYRLGFYLLALALGVILALNVAKILLARHVRVGPIVQFLYWDLAILALLIALNEFSIWRKRRHMRHD